MIRQVCGRVLLVLVLLYLVVMAFFFSNLK